MIGNKDEQHKFVYVFDIASRDKLLAAGFTLLKEDIAAQTFTFMNDGKMTFALDDITHVSTNMLTF